MNANSPRRRCPREEAPENPPRCRLSPRTSGKALLKHVLRPPPFDVEDHLRGFLQRNRTAEAVDRGGADFEHLQSLLAIEPGDSWAEGEVVGPSIRPCQQKRGDIATVLVGPWRFFATIRSASPARG